MNRFMKIKAPVRAPETTGALFFLTSSKLRAIVFLDCHPRHGSSNVQKHPHEPI